MNITRLTLCCIAIVAMSRALQAQQPAAQNLQLTITDKTGSGAQRGNLTLQYTFRGVNVDQSSQPPIRLTAGRVTTNANGAVSIPLPIQELRNAAGRLDNSEQVELTLEPIASADDLVSLTLDFLLGSAPHNMSIVMMSRKYGAADVEGFVHTAYIGGRSTLHLLVENGTIYYRLNGKNRIEALDFEMATDKFLIYKEISPEGNYWAVSLDCCISCRRRRCDHQERCKVWLYQPDAKSPAWRQFDTAKRVSSDE